MEAGKHRRMPEALVVGAVALLAALAMISFVFANQGFVPTADDPYEYGRIAHGLVEHGFTKLTRRAAMLYPHLLWVIYLLGGNDTFVKFLQAALHAASSVLTFQIGRRLYNVRTGFIAGVVTALHPMLLRYVSSLHTETLLVFLSTLLVLLAIRMNERPTVGRGIVFGAVGMLAAIAKGVFLPVVVAYGAVWGWRWLRSPGRAWGSLMPLVAMFVTMAVVVAPWTYRNYRVSGKPVLLTPGMPDAFLRGYIFTRLEFATLEKPPYTFAEMESNALFRRIAAENGTTWELDEVADDANNGKVMKRMIVEHPLDTVRKVVVGLFTFWYEMTSLRNSLVPGLLALASWILAFFGFRRAYEEGRPSWLLLLPIVVTNVFVAILIPLGRYSVPILPCLSILAAFGVDTLLVRRESPIRGAVPAQVGR